MSKSGDRLLERQQNKVRGALGEARRHFQKGGNRELSSRFEIRRALLEARKELPRNLRSDFFNWLERLRAGMGASLEEALLQDLSTSVIKSDEVDVGSELEWIGFRLGPVVGSLRKFRESAAKLNDAFWAEDADECASVLDDMRKVHGESLWLIIATIAIKQYFAGLEVQKDYVADVRKKYPGGLPAYLAFFTSARNEQRATVALFDEDLTERLNAGRLSDDLKTYLRFKLTQDFDCTDASVSAVLRAEQSQSVIDLYETAIEVLQRCLARRNLVPWRAGAISLLNKLTGVQDSRVEKLLFGLTGELPASRIQSGPGTPLGGFKGALPHSIWIGIWALITNAEQPAGKDERNDPLLERRLHALFGSLLSRDEDFEDSRARVTKFARNFSFLPSMRAIADFCEFLFLESENTPKALGAASLNSAAFSGADLLYVDEDVLDDASQHLRSIVAPAEADEWRAAQDPAHPPTIKPAAWYCRALRLSASDGDAARDLIEDFPRAAAPDGLWGLIINLHIQLSLASGDLNKAIALIAHAIACNPGTIMMMPVKEAIGNRDWEALSGVPDKLDLAIALLAYWRQTDDSLHATYLRFAFEEVLAQFNIFLPGDIEPKSLKTDKRLLLFAADICIPVLMDTSGLFVSSAELLEERMRTLVSLIEADPDNKEIYATEVAELRLQKLIKSGMEIVDSNRVSVDMDALTRWANKRYRESYLRYQALRAAGVGLSVNFDEVVKEIRRHSHAEGEYFTIPKNEADTLLLEIIVALQNQFLTDSQYGLEYFLGKRVRHGTIAGHMRGPAEARSLITERRSPQSPYEPNMFWVDRMSVTSSESTQEVLAAFDHFSEEYDSLIAEVRDRYLHVKSADHPDGLFDIGVSAAQYHILVALAADLEFEAFISVTLNSFWSLLTPSLAAAKEYLGSTVKGGVVQLFAELQTALQGAVHDEAYRNVSIAIQETSAEVQRELDTVVGYFDRIESKHISHTFALQEVVEVGIQSALKTLTNFEPNIGRSVDGEWRAAGAVLIVVSDILFVVLDNVYRRARAGYRPDISISCAIDVEAEMMTISAQNPIGDDVDLNYLSRRLDNVRSKIAAGDITTGAAADRGSGLLKIAAMVRHYNGAKLEFGFVGDGEFRTEVRLPIFFTADQFSLLPSEVE